MIDTIIGNFNKIAGTILSSVLVAYIGYRTYKKTRFNRASDLFRGKVLAILEGYYPVVHSRDGTDYMKIRETVPKIESIAADFSHFLRGSTKRRFSGAVKQYCDYCKAVNRENDHARARFDHPTSPKPETEPLTTENLARHVDTLLSFAKEK